MRLFKRKKERPITEELHINLSPKFQCTAVARPYDKELQHDHYESNAILEYLLGDEVTPAGLTDHRADMLAISSMGGKLIDHDVIKTYSDKLAIKVRSKISANSLVLELDNGLRTAVVSDKQGERYMIVLRSAICGLPREFKQGLK